MGGRKIERHRIDGSALLRFSQRESGMRTKGTTKKTLSQAVVRSLGEKPGQSVKEIALSLKVNRQFLSGYLTCLEENGEVTSRSVGPARIYFAVKEGPV